MSAPKRTYKIAAIPADGVGKEVVAAGRRVLDALAEHSNGAFGFTWDEFDWGSEYYARNGRMMAEDGLETLKRYDAIYFGAVGWPTVPDHITLWGLRLNITQNFDQWANVRPVHFHPGVVSPLRKADDTHLDWVVVRENSEGEYAGLGGRNLSARGPGNEVALQTALFTEKGCERIIRFAFDLARTRRVKKVSSVTKSNAQQYGMVLWDETFARVAPTTPTSPPRACSSTPCPPSSCSSPRTSRSSSPPTSTPTSCPTWARRSRAASAWPPARTTTPSAASRACSSPSTARRPTSPGRACQPHRDDPVRGADARALRSGRRGRPRAEGGRRRHRLRCPHP